MNGGRKGYLPKMAHFERAVHRKGSIKHPKLLAHLKFENRLWLLQPLGVF